MSERALQAQPHHRLRADAQRAQVMRQPVGARIELAVAQASRPRTPPRSHRGLRAACAANSSGSVASGDRMRGVVPAPQDASRAPPALRMSRLPDRTLRLRNRRLQQPDEPPRQRLHARPLEQVGGVFDRTRQSPPARRPRRAPRSALSDRSNLALAVATGSNRAVKPGQPRSSPPHCSGTPASPGTADGATASAPG